MTLIFSYDELTENLLKEQFGSDERVKYLNLQ